MARRRRSTHISIRCTSSWATIEPVHVAARSPRPRASAPESSRRPLIAQSASRANLESKRRDQPSERVR